MKFQEYLKMKGNIHESVDLKKIAILEGIDLNGLDLDLSDLNVDEAIKNLNYSYEGAPILNEDMTAIMARITTGINYLRCQSILPKYEKAAMEADSNIIGGRFSKKIEAISKKMEVLAAQGAKASGRAQKEQFVQKREALQKVIDKIKLGQESYQEKMNQARDKIKAEIDELTGVMSEPLKGLVTKNITAITNKVKLAGLDVKAETTMRDVEDPKRKELFQKEYAEINKKYEEAMSKLDDGEDAADSDIEELESIDLVKGELKTFLGAADEVKKQKAALKKIWDEADAANPDVDSSEDAKYEIQYDSDYYDLFEDKNQDSGKTPLEVFQAINGIPIKDDKGNQDEDNLKTKIELYKKLKPLVATYKKAVEDRIIAKKAMWDKIPKGQGVTKDLLVLAGADPETTEKDSDGNFTKDKAKLSKKWEAAFTKPEEYGPLKDVTSIEYKYKDPAKPNDPAVNKKGTLEDAITDKEAALPAPAAPAEKSEYEKAKDANYVDYTGTETDLAKIKNEPKDPSDSTKGNKYKDAKEVKDPADETKKKIMVLPESRQFKSGSRIVPTFESFIHSRGLK